MAKQSSNLGQIRRTPHLAEVILCYEHRGSGAEDDPRRSVLRVYSVDGELLAENDSFHPPETLLGDTDG